MTCPVTQYAEDVTTGKEIACRLVKLACARHLRDRQDGHKRGLRWSEAHARHIIDWVEKRLVLYDGKFAGQPFLLQPFQRFILGSVFGWLNADGFRRYRQAYVEAAKGCGKALALDTLIPTPTGWTTMGDIQPGDKVFDETGTVCTVLGTSAVMFGHDCYRVRFSDGCEIVADAEHLWLTHQLQSGRSNGDALRGVPKAEWKRAGSSTTAIRTTAQIAETLSCRSSTSKQPQAKWNHRVDVAGPLQIADAELPIEPYVLGCWLGDGNSDDARLTCGKDDAEILGHIAACGVSVTHQTADKRNGTLRVKLGGQRRDVCRRGHSRAGREGRTCLVCERYNDRRRRGHDLPFEPFTEVSMQERLRKLGLLGNKHIPREYLRASESQRMALLQGLMDTDGYIDIRGACEFTTTSPALRDGFMELARTLGYKVGLSTGTATIYGQDCGEKYRIAFQANADRPVFRLSRKIARLRPAPATRQLSRGRMIVACDPVPSVPVKCIAVDSPSHLYLASEGMIPTHNTPLLSAIGLYGLTADKEPGAEIYSAATSLQQAMVMFRDALELASNSPTLAAKLNIQKRNIAYESQSAFFRPVARDHKAQSGPRPHFNLIDEVHEHPDGQLIQKMKAGHKARRQPLTFEITNAGCDRETVCWEHHEYTVKILEGLLDNDHWFGFIANLDPCDECWDKGFRQPNDACEECDDWRDEAVWPKANPGLGRINSWDSVRQQVEMAKGMPTQEGIVKRLHMTCWTESATRAIPMDRWEACSSAIDLKALEGMECYGGLDIGATSDFTAFVLLFAHDDVDFVEVPIDPKDPDAGTRQMARRSYSLVPWFWLPARPVRRDERMSELINVWCRQGFIKTTPGDTVDYDIVADDIIELSERFPMRKIVFDRGFQGVWIGTRLLNHFGDEVVQYLPQGLLSMAPPFREFLELLVNGRIKHDGNPVLRWMASNCAAETRNGLSKPSKEHSGDKIDGICSICMALAAGMAAESPGFCKVEAW